MLFVAVVIALFYHSQQSKAGISIPCQRRVLISVVVSGRRIPCLGGLAMIVLSVYIGVCVVGDDCVECVYLDMCGARGSTRPREVVGIPGL